MDFTGDNIEGVMNLPRYLILNHGKDHEHSGFWRLPSFFSSINTEGDLQVTQPDELSSRQGKRLHAEGRVFIYHCNGEPEQCAFYQNVLAQILKAHPQIGNPPHVFIHRGDDVELKDAKPVVDWRRQVIGGNPIVHELADELVRANAVGIPMSRGARSGLSWALDLIQIHDIYLDHVVAEHDYISPDYVIPGVSRAFKSACEYYGV